MPAGRAVEGRSPGVGPLYTTKENHLIVLGVILILLAMLLDVSLLYTIGAILAVIGAVLWILGAFGRQIGPRAHYY